MAMLSVTEQQGLSRVLGSPVLPTWQRVTIGAMSGVMPVLVSQAVVQAAPLMDAVAVLLGGGREGVPAVTNATATLLGLALLTMFLAVAGVLSALCQGGQVERLALFQTTLVAPALLYVAIQVIGFATAPGADDGRETSAQVLVTGVTQEGGDPVRIAVYQRPSPEPVACFLQGLRGRGC